VVSLLFQIRESVRERCDATAAAHPDWPCRKGCDDCCRSLAAVPRVSAPEWRDIAAALDALPAPIAEAARARIAASAAAERPIVCPLLDTAAGACLVYEARPIACRAYGFYAERDLVLGCYRIATLAADRPEIVWGNHPALESQLGPTAPLHEQLAP
jgi:Fe-S-cluster containining protein